MSPFLDTSKSSRFCTVRWTWSRLLRRILGQAPKEKRSLGTARLIAWAGVFFGSPMSKSMFGTHMFFDATLNTAHSFQINN